MKCLHCQGEIKKGETPLPIDSTGCHLTLDKVPAWVSHLPLDWSSTTLRDVPLSVASPSEYAAKHHPNLPEQLASLTRIPVEWVAEWSRNSQLGGEGVENQCIGISGILAKMVIQLHKAKPQFALFD
jgi:hypothetical protein